ERRGKRLRIGGTEAPLALAREVDGGRLQAQQQGRRLGGRRFVAEVVRRELREAELLGRRALPQEVDVDVLGELARGRQQLAGRGAVEPQVHVGRLDLGAT